MSRLVQGEKAPYDGAVYLPRTRNQMLFSRAFKLRKELGSLPHVTIDEHGNTENRCKEYDIAYSKQICTLENYTK